MSETNSDETKPNETKPKKMVRRSVVVALGIVCIVLIVVGLVGAVTYVIPMINDKDTLTTQYNDYVANHHYTDQQYASENASGYAIGISEGNSAGYQSGYSVGYEAGVASRGFNIVDPTYQQMSNFMTKDTVHNNAYSSTYVCWNFCNDYNNEAFKAGWRCGFVYIDYQFSSHAVVCFNTIDRGIVFVEPQFNQIVKVEIGQSYSYINGFQSVMYDDTIVNFGIIW